MTVTPGKPGVFFLIFMVRRPVDCMFSIGSSISMLRRLLHLFKRVNKNIPHPFSLLFRMFSTFEK